MGQAPCPHRGTIRAKPHSRSQPLVVEEPTESQYDRLTAMVELMQGPLAGTFNFDRNFVFYFDGNSWKVLRRSSKKMDSIGNTANGVIIVLCGD